VWARWGRDDDCGIAMDEDSLPIFSRKWPYKNPSLTSQFTVLPLPSQLVHALLSYDSPSLHGRFILCSTNRKSSGALWLMITIRKEVLNNYKKKKKWFWCLFWIRVCHLEMAAKTLPMYFIWFKHIRYSFQRGYHYRLWKDRVWTNAFGFYWVWVVVVVVAGKGSSACSDWGDSNCAWSQCARDALYLFSGFRNALLDIHKFSAVSVL
jgi:hypothetical protein